MRIAIATVARTEDLTDSWQKFNTEQDKILKPYNTFERFCLLDKPIAQARQEITETIIASKKFTHILFIDSDTFVTAEQILYLADKIEELDVLCYPVYLKQMPLISNIYIDMMYMPLSKLPRGMFKIELTGLAACIIDLNVFKKIEKPWYKGSWKLRSGVIDFHLKAGEDTAFFYKLKKEGIDIYCDPKYIPSHWDRHSDVYYPDEITNKERCYYGQKKRITSR